MSVTTDTLRLLAQMRLRIDAEVGSVEDRLARAWITAWDSLATSWREAAEAVADAWADGIGPSRWEIERLDRVQAALLATQAELERLSDLGVLEVTDAAGRVIDLTPAAMGEAMASQLPAYLDRAGFAVEWGRLDAEALRAIVLRTTEQIASSFRPLSADALDAMYRALVRGIGAGDNPRQVARLMLRLEQGFNGGLARALNIARTEMLDAHRESSRASRTANADVLRGWTWLATLDRRTCISCLVQHGSEHPPEEFGPIDHQQGRCTAVPLLRSWRELGIPVEEPPSLIPDAREWFDALPAAAQAEIVGRDVLALLRSGAVPWEALSALRPGRGWRDSYGPRSLADLRLLARRAA